MVIITSNGLAPLTTYHCFAVYVVPIWRLWLLPPFWRAFVPITTSFIPQWRRVLSSRVI